MEEVTYPFGYCTNVHAGPSLEGAKANLLKYAASVRQQVVPDGTLPLGLWLAAEAASSLLEAGRLSEFGLWLREHHFVPYTFNGFPQGDFHQAVVKHAVYEPTWKSASRLEFTMALARILAGLLRENDIGSISTLPLGWPHVPWQQQDFEASAENLLKLAIFLDQLYQQTGREIVIAIESEPGCVLNTATEICDFFQGYLFAGTYEKIARRHLGVCHDICHSGVMFEPQSAALSCYHDAGIRIGKVQVSSAVHVPWDECRGDAREQAKVLEQLRTFDEPKYLHQATRADANLRLEELSEDLSGALEAWMPTSSFPQDPWRIHFHVPIFVDRFGSLKTTQSDILEATDFLARHRYTEVAGSRWFTGHYEVETYAWPVLPAPLAVKDLASGIAQELTFFSSVLENATG